MGEPATATARPRGIVCWGCNRRYVWGDTPRSGPLEAIDWSEGLCFKADCPMWSIVGDKPPASDEIAAP